jgi:hypothetical protein
VTTNTGITGIAFTFDPNGRFWTQIPDDVDLFRTSATKQLNGRP